MAFSQFSADFSCLGWLSRQCGVKSTTDYIFKMVGYGANKNIISFYQNQIRT
ncbi:hypothetical protein CWATWH8502_4698 [Crocosphaera watsonii WH 8502]|uniref:Uncharacterized protein n=3 Tax=Crocosphaera watsonii TaxID=263511 RepID=G5J5J4_CROWT|nr:hypothetical protein CWATWH0003_2754 [Crocosphaera watsonii WH 0003]CCQ51000.1 hypothetical protein CWATWH8502_4698 [Crocosphaera watsonii WH 8502]CCQ57737.1 hypothetical protein CWATWH0005_5244 [Crocosphaera watsonii WH 0005]